MAKHLTLDERNIIAQRLNEGCSFKAIANELEKNCTTISREIQNHLVFKKVGAPGRAFNACKHRFSCQERHICADCPDRRTFSLCKSCMVCNSVCKHLEPDICQKLKSHTLTALFPLCCKKNNPCTIFAQTIPTPPWSAKVLCTVLWMITFFRPETSTCPEKSVTPNTEKVTLFPVHFPKRMTLR